MNSPRIRVAPGRPRARRLRWIAGIALAVLAAIAATLGAAGFFDRDAVHLFAAEGPRKPIAALFVSGDMGLRFGLGPPTYRSLAAHGITVVGLNSATLFATRKTRAEVDAIIANAVRDAIARTGSQRLMLIGQSYGADVLQTGLAHLPADLRGHVAGVVLVVPGKTVFFRADPSNIVYHGTPDSLAATTVNQLGWTRLTCIYGVAETDSVCPDVRIPTAHVVGMPGGHFLAHDEAGLQRHVLAAVRDAAPDAFRN